MRAGNRRMVLVRRSKNLLSDGAVLEMVIWRVPEPVKGSSHDFKYRLFYGRDGERIVGYHNEPIKGDHRHLEGREEPYAFATVDALVRDFLVDVQRRRSGK